MSSFFEGKVVWITGASSGLGEGLANELAAEKARLVLSSRREAELLRVKKDCLKFIPEENILVLPGDLADTSHASLLAEKIIQRFGRIDILINNGGVSQRAEAGKTPLEVERKIMEINYFGSVAMTKAVLPHMQKQQGGHLVVISSVMGKFGYPLRATYCASKHALQGYFESLRQEIHGDHIAVTLICPGYLRTNVSFNAVTEQGGTLNIMAPGQEKGMDPRKAAKKTLRAIQAEKYEAYIGGKELLAVTFHRLFPDLFYRVLMQFDPHKKKNS